MTFGCRPNIDRTGILIAQLGTPDAPTAKALRPYLKQFLSDPRVIELPRLLWWCILNFFILNTRPKRSARLYARIWTKDGSPLLVNTRALTEKLEKKLRSEGFKGEVAFGMRYGSFSLEKAIDDLIAKGCGRILLVPMYPQYSATTTASIYDAVFLHLLKRRHIPTLRVLEPYYKDARYIKALADSVDTFIAANGVPDRIVLSYHGIPERYIKNGDPYCCACSETTKHLLPQLNYHADKVIHTYQSRFGREPWLVPYTDVTLDTLAKEGVKKVFVLCPGFSADCLETLDEIGNEGHEAFIEHGGEELKLIPCLNADDHWVDTFSQIVVDELGSWRQLQESPDCTHECPIAAAKKRGIFP